MSAGNVARAAEAAGVMDRPRLCPEPRCEPAHQVGQINAGPGESWSCWGRMVQPVTFCYDGNEHANDLRSCHYTPLKGVVAYLESREDWRALGDAYRVALAKVERP